MSCSIFRIMTEKQCGVGLKSDYDLCLTIVENNQKDCSATMTYNIQQLR
jgi:hypothetical protein